MFIACFGQYCRQLRQPMQFVPMLARPLTMLMFPRGQSQSPKVRAFVDFLLERVNLDIDYMKARCPNACGKPACTDEDAEAEMSDEPPFAVLA